VSWAGNKGMIWFLKRLRRGRNTEHSFYGKAAGFSISVATIAADFPR